MTLITYKMCRVCLIEKPASDFNAHKTTRDRLSSWCRECTAIRKKEYPHTRPKDKRRDRDNGRERHRKLVLRRLNVPEEQIPTIVLEAGTGSCHICGCYTQNLNTSVPSTARLHVDHCHQTNQYRGLLCLRCNLALGMVDDDPEILMNMILYLRKRENVLSQIALV